MLSGLSVTIPEDKWEPTSIGNALLSSIEVNGLLLHLEAWEMHDIGDGEYAPVNPDLVDDYDDLYRGAIRDGAPNLLEIGGKEYFVFAVPGT